MRTRQISIHILTVGAISLSVFSLSAFWTSLPATAQIMRTQAAVKNAPDTKLDFRFPQPKQIFIELTPFEASPITATWAAQTKQIVNSLCTETTIGEPAARQKLILLASQVSEIDSLIRMISAAPPQSAQTLPTQTLPTDSIALISELQRFKYRLGRRVEIWNSVCQLAISSRATSQPQAMQNVSLKRIAFENIDLDQGWQDYLEIDALAKASRSLTPNEAQQRDAARKFLSRLHSPALDTAQKQHLDERVINALDPRAMALIRSAATDKLNPRLMLGLMEILEGKTTKRPPGMYASMLNAEYQNLLWSTDPAAQRLAGQIDSNWRNANVRVAVNERMLNMMLPQMPATTEAISDSIQGAKVSGQGLIENQLRIALIPNPDEIAIRLETIGQVTTDTVASKSGFIFQNKGLANFQVFKNLAFNRSGVTSESPQATSSATQRLVGLRGNYDRIPLIGRLTRMIAKQKAEEQAPEAELRTRERVETDAKERVQTEVEQQVQQLRWAMNHHVLSRLTAMDLEPETIQLSTSQQRIVGRYRIAGRDQMAAHQPRPTDFESDLLTFQMHESAINNLLQRFNFGGQEFNAVSLGEHIEAMTGIPLEAENSEADATFEFSDHDPIRIDFADGIASLKFGFKKFQIGNGRGWQNISVTARFKPEYIGTRIILNLQNPLDVAGRNLRLPDEIAIRTAFKVILDQQYAFELMPKAIREKVPHLAFAIERLSFADSWCGVTITDAAKLNRSVPIVQPENVVPGSYSDQLGAFQRHLPLSREQRTARQLNSSETRYR